MTRADITAIAFATVLLPILYYFFWQTNENATQARITDAQHHVTLADLNQAKQLHINGKLGESVLSIKNGKIRFTHSPCKGKVCIHRGWLHYSGETMACLPNKVLVMLTGGEAKYDSINF